MFWRTEYGYTPSTRLKYLVPSTAYIYILQPPTCALHPEVPWAPLGSSLPQNIPHSQDHFCPPSGLATVATPLYMLEWGSRTISNGKVVLLHLLSRTEQCCYSSSLR